MPTVTRDDVRRRLESAYKFLRRYYHWIGEDNLALIEGLRQLVMEEDDVADQLALILESKK